MEKSKKRTIMQAVVCVGLMCVIWGGYFWANMEIKKEKNQQINLVADDFSWVYQVDSVGVENKEVVIQGFAFELDSDALEGAFEIVLHDIETGKNYFPKMEYMMREDVNSYFLCDYDYLQSGFIASIKAKKLELEDKNYEVLLRVSGEKTAYQTGTYISDGEIVYVNPTEFEPLDVIGTDLEEVVEQGVLRAYRPEYGMYIYQYNGEMYWIAEDDYEFDEDGNTYVQYQLDTTQIEKLPEVRLQNEWYWDNIGFKFVDNELIDWEIGGYRVTKNELPTEYSIIKVLTGNYIDGWIWKQEFRPFYQFEK